ncbi:outer membrane protein, OMP85 family [Selenomonas sp. oral taxon 892 str. F0426]|uniref:BamA/OMP85 family outer membrane protein n=1 Tax=Selenomonas sp. oral taxon 892 TaxID=1321785 RepID=UPI0003AD0138|nr:outer membrane protein assembly factor [Selenomonas sp. oral taxon 892]ERJ95794.1 outer membrane protein, OMP85 family [Selenomonas sp. oral taxon 892 str. F0426]
MNSKKYQRLTLAVALSVGVSAFTLPHAFAAEEAAAETAASASAAPDAPVLSDAAPSAVMDSTGTVVTDAPTLTAAPAPTNSDERAAAWAEKRPAEQEISNYLAEQIGKTIVEINFSGATEATEPTARAALAMHVGDAVSEEGLTRDRDAIYATGYFYDLYPTFEKVPEGVVLTYNVLENPELKEVKIEGNTVESTETLMGLVTVKNGELLNSRVLQENVQAIQEKYRADGYILAKITDLNIAQDGTLTIKISEGMLEGYKVKGNKKTKEHVILREMRQKVGEPFNANMARRSMQRVYNLGFFEDVNVKMNPGVEPNAVIMELDVKEKRTGSFGIGAGYSSSDGMVGMVSVSDTNFRGMGDTISLSYEMSGDDTDARGYTFMYRRPWLDKKETAGTLRLYNRTYEYDDYDENGNHKESFMRKYAGGEFTLSRPMSEYSTNFVTLRNRQDKYVKHTESGNAGNRSGASAWIKNNFGTTRSITLEHVTDTRDNIYEPTMGARASLSAEFAGFGGDFSYQKYTLGDAHYLKAGRAQVFVLRGQYGISKGTISEYSQFRVGGQDTIRGYREDQFRGTRMALLSAEYRFPIVSKVTGALFTDYGGAWTSGFMPENMHVSVGIGLGLNTPIGPLRLDYGRGSQGGRVHFRVGGTF